MQELIVPIQTSHERELVIRKTRTFREFQEADL